MPRRRRDYPTPQREARANNPETRRKYLEYLRDYNKARNEKETREFQKGKQKFRGREVQREQDRVQSYQEFVQNYGTPEEKADHSKREPSQQEVQRWWNGPGQYDRWVGADDPQAGGQRVEKPRRTGDPLGNLIGGLFGGSSTDNQAEESSNDNDDDDNGGGIGIFRKAW